jgi:hypothetical protein
MLPGRDVNDGISFNQLIIPISLAGKSNEIITTAHPISIDQALELLPDRVRIREDKPYFDKLDKRVFKKEILEVRDLQADQSGDSAEVWKKANSTLIEVTGEEAEKVTLAHEQRYAEEKKLLDECRHDLEFPLQVSQIMADYFKSEASALACSAKDRLAALEMIGKVLKYENTHEDDGRTSYAAGSRLDNFIKKKKDIGDQMEKISILSRKIAKEKGWSVEWLSELRQAMDSASGAIANHTFAQEVIKEGTPAAEIEERLRKYILEQGVKDVQEGKKIDLNGAIDGVLENLVQL